MTSRIYSLLISTKTSRIRNQSVIFFVHVTFLAGKPKLTCTEIFNAIASSLNSHGPTNGSASYTHAHPFWPWNDYHNGAEWRPKIPRVPRQAQAQQPHAALQRAGFVLLTSLEIPSINLIYRAHCAAYTRAYVRQLRPHVNSGVVPYVDNKPMPAGQRSALRYCTLLHVLC